MTNEEDFSHCHTCSNFSDRKGTKNFWNKQKKITFVCYFNKNSGSSFEVDALADGALDDTDPLCVIIRLAEQNTNFLYKSMNNEDFL